MDKREKNDTKEKISRCDCCQAEIPMSAVFHPAGIDYVRHFCGPDCYDKWVKEHPDKNVSKF